MLTQFRRLRATPQPPLWVSLPVFLGVIVTFPLLLPYGPDLLLDILIEGLFLFLAVLIVILARRLHQGLLDIGLQVFVLGRLVDFMDELFVEPEPFVEPYLSGFLMVVSLGLVVVGVYSLLDERDERLGELEQRTSELALKNKVIDEAPIGITVADMTSEDEPLTHINDAFTHMTGYDAAETVGSNCRFLQGEDTDPEKVRQMRTAIDTGESVQVTLRNYRKDGTLFWNEITLAPLSEAADEPARYAGFQQDATERKEYEHQLKEQRDNLDVLNQMLQHDIRNALQPILANATVLQKHTTPDGAAHLETIQDAARDATSLTQTAQELSKTMLDDDPDDQLLSLSATVSDEVEDLRAMFEDATVELDGSIPDVNIKADEMLSSVFRNILRNAVQHNDKETPEVTVSTTATADTARVRIADNGPGVHDDRKDAIFGQGEKGLESGGTGIGTYLVDTLVTRYGGRVWIEDNEPEGAVFVVELPIAG